LIINDRDTSIETVSFVKLLSKCKTPSKNDDSLWLAKKHYCCIAANVFFSSQKSKQSVSGSLITLSTDFYVKAQRLKAIAPVASTTIAVSPQLMLM
jgi:hypothetical protein